MRESSWTGELLAYTSWPPTISHAESYTSHARLCKMPCRCVGYRQLFDLVVRNSQYYLYYPHSNATLMQCAACGHGRGSRVLYAISVYMWNAENNGPAGPEISTS